MTTDDHDDTHDDHGGLQRDLPHLLDRRQAMRWMGGLSLAGLLAACRLTSTETPSTGAVSTDAPAVPSPTSTAPTTTGPAPTSPPASASTTAPATGLTSVPADQPAATPGDEIPDETAGPFPADGSNGPNVLGIEGVMRDDMTASFGGLSGAAEGIPATIHLTVVDAGTGSPLPGAVVYLWHCTADGRYSIYEIPDQNYLRGARTADESGNVTFATIFPGCYRGRWPHCHFEVYPSLDDATAGAAAIKISQLALPQADCEVVYADARYGSSADNLSRLSLSTDGVFRDGWEDQLAVVRGSVTDGYTATLLVRV